jgi:cytochrome oxidase assembly protein ShyY1
MRTTLILFGVLAAVVAAGLAALGHWQLARAAAKEEMLARIERAQSMAPRPIERVLAESSDPSFSAVTVTAAAEIDHQVLLDNQLREGRPGVRAYVPLRRPDGSRVLLDAGWLAWPARSEPPPTAALASPQGPFTGILLPPPGGGISLGGATAWSWPLLVTRIEADTLAERFGGVLLPYVLEPLDSPRAKSVRAGMLPPERHRAYAVQWFGLAATVLVIYLTLAWRALRPARNTQ